MKVLWGVLSRLGRGTRLRLLAVLAVIGLAPAAALVGQTLPIFDSSCTGSTCTLSDGSTFTFNETGANSLSATFSGPSFGGSGSIDVTYSANGELFTITGLQVLNGTSTSINCTINLSTGELVGGECGQFFDTAVLNAEAPAQVVAESVATTSKNVVRDQVRSTTALISNRLRNLVGQYVRSRLQPASAMLEERPYRYGTGLSAGSNDARFGVWIDGSVTLVDNDKSNVQSDGKTEVALVGIDYRLREDVIVGVSAGYQGAQLTVGSIRGRRDSNGYVLTPYASYIMAPNMSVDASVSYGGSDTDVESNLTGTRVTGSFDSRRVTATGNWNIYEAVDAWFLTGFAGYSYSWEFQDDYTDTSGARIDNGTIRYGVLRFGGEAAYRAGAFEPYALSILEIETTDPKDSDRETLVVGAGLRYFAGPITAAVEFSAQTLRADESGYTFGLNLRYVF